MEIKKEKVKAMLPAYEELVKCKEMSVSKERALWNIARELSRKNDLLEIEMLCKTAETLRTTAKGSLGDLHFNGYVMAEELACMAHKKITSICGSPEEVLGDSEKETDDIDEIEG